MLRIMFTEKYSWIMDCVTGFWIGGKLRVFYTRVVTLKENEGNAEKGILRSQKENQAIILHLLVCIRSVREIYSRSLGF